MSRAGITLAITGAAFLVVSVFLPWVDAGGETENAFKPGAAFLFDFQSGSEGGFSVGVLTLILGAATLGLVLRRAPSLTWRVAGGGALAVVLAYTIQLARLLDLAGDSTGGLFDTLGYGVYVAIAGAVLVLVTPGPIPVRPPT